MRTAIQYIARRVTNKANDILAAQMQQAARKICERQRFFHRPV
jgi:hypothetical protein